MQIIKDRQALHQIPELDRDLPETTAYVKSILDPLPCRVFSPTEGSLCAFFDFGAQEAIAFRADMDALPVMEANDVPYASRHVGNMHACGHDGHTAILLELARRLSGKRLPHNVLLVFQPAEETTGGAKAIVDSGVFQEYHVKAIFGLHLWPGLPEGVVHSRKNELMSRTSNLLVDISGKSAHIALSHLAKDALAAGVLFYQRAAAMEKALPENIFRLLKFGKFTAGTVGNAIANSAHFEGALRAFQDEIFEKMRDDLYAIAKGVEEETGCTVKLSFHEGYPAVMNPPALYDKINAIEPLRALDKPSMTAEDFAWYQKTIPGMFFFLGIGDTPALHANNFNFNEQILVKGADFFEKLAENYR